MARKTLRYTVEDQGRDLGKVFLLTEMSASAAEAWAMRIVLALLDGNPDMPIDLMRSGMAGIAAIGVIKAIGGLKWSVSKPLLDEMWECVKIIPNPGPKEMARKPMEEDIEEVITRFNLRVAVLELHMGFSEADEQ